jgi:hypothetical protein
MTQIAGSNKSISITTQSDMMSIVIRYAIVIVLSIIVIFNMNNSNIQFIMFITQLFLIIIAGTFIVKDLSSSSERIDNKNPVNLFTINKTFTNIFMFALIGGIIVKIISISLFVIVFSYGRSQLKPNSNNKNIKLTADNNKLFNKYFLVFIFSSLLIGILSLLIFIGNTSPEARYLIINISSLMLSLGVLGLTGYEMYSALNFFKVYRRNGIVYQKT